MGGKQKQKEKQSVQRRVAVEVLLEEIEWVVSVLGAASRSPLCSEEGRQLAWAQEQQFRLVTVKGVAGPGTEVTFSHLVQCVANSYEKLGPVCAKLRRAAAERWGTLASNKALRDVCVSCLPGDVQRRFARSVLFVEHGLCAVGRGE